MILWPLDRLDDECLIDMFFVRFGLQTGYTLPFRVCYSPQIPVTDFNIYKKQNSHKIRSAAVFIDSAALINRFGPKSN